MKLYPLALFISLGFVSHAFSQTVEGNFVSADREVSTGSYTIHWTVGEIITETFTTSEITLISGVKTTTGLTVTAVNPEVTERSINVFPNPFSETLTITSDQISLDEAAFTFLDPLGKNINLSILDFQKDRVSFLTRNLQSGVYILTVKNNNNFLTHIKVLHE